MIAGLYNPIGAGRSLWFTSGAGISAKGDSLLTAFLRHPELGVQGGGLSTIAPSRSMTIICHPSPFIADA